MIFEPFTELMAAADNNTSTLETAFTRLYIKNGGKYTMTQQEVFEELELMKNE